MINRKSIAPLAVLCLCLCALHPLAQGKAKHMLAKLTPADFALPATTIIDSNTNAVILADLGDVHFIGNKNDWFSYVFVRQTRIKILDKNAFDLATVSVGLYGETGDDMDKLTNVTASAYNLENGQLRETKLDPKDIYSTRTDKHWTEAKFSVPGVKEGSILEYTYTITSRHDFDLPEWEFQSKKYPCLSSEYHVEIPQTLNYVLVRQGIHPYAIDKGSSGNAVYSVSEKADQSALGAPDHDYTVSAITVKHDWVMKDIPAFGTERYLTTPDNYIDKISFQESGIYNGEESIARTNTWAKATDELLTESEFGGALNEDDDAIAALAEKIPAGSGSLDAAKAVYYYVSRHFTCTSYGYYVRTNLRDVIRTNSGTVGEINLLLTGLLRKKGFEADPVLLSTRDYGFNLATYPMLEKLNYVIVRLHLGDRIYYLDAARPKLGFGSLAPDCYNGHARIISKTDSGSVYFWADSLRESKVTMVLMTSTDKGLAGSWQSYPGMLESYDVRRRIAEHGQDQFFKDIQTSWGDDAEISNGGIDSVDSLEEPVKVHYDFLLKQQSGASLLYFYPLMGDDWRTNPFKAAERKYPVEMYHTIDQTYVFSLMIPDGYVVDELPKSAKVAFNGDQGYFEYLIANQGGQIQLRCRVKLNKAWFSPEDYGALRDFFAFIVKKENEQIVLKKQ
jgi:transglutaminase-like putative cysteine protease